ncbi:hypothetical protein HanXRQr2_Chr06g0264791 [Helianthus annuus]|uniref:Uncharacterized protein n=1 Tax=Helianthus annuus TaxID=4232 RepID=A0A9K3NKH1_HELAN|nr:hypothetical protein HanXRQr2_Chr06g0264791 [Helianthus annuus]
MFVELLSFDKIRQPFIVGLLQKKKRKLCPIFVKIRNTKHNYVVKRHLLKSDSF